MSATRSALALRRAAAEASASTSAASSSSSSSSLSARAAPGPTASSRQQRRTLVTSACVSSTSTLLQHTSSAWRRPTAPAALATAAAARNRLQQRQQRSAGLHSLHPFPPRFDGTGCEPFLSKKAFDLIFTEYHGGLLERLNDEVRGTEYETASVSETVIGTAQDRSKILAFNLASQALNNSFFLNGLKPKIGDGPAPAPDSEQTKHPGVRTFLQALRASPYQNLSALKSAFSAAALGMASSGWVWLVRDQHGKLGIVPTYGAGTLLVQGRYQCARGGATPSLQDPLPGAVDGGVAAAPAAGLGQERGGVTPAAGQSDSAAVRDNVGAALGGGVNAPSSQPAPPLGESSTSSSNDPANRIVPPAPGASSSPAAQGNTGGTIGGGVGVGGGARSFSTSAFRLAGEGDGMKSDFAGSLRTLVDRSAAASRGAGSVFGSGALGGSAGATAAAGGRRGAHMPPLGNSTSLSANLGGFGAASPNGPGFRRGMPRRQLDEYEADAGAALLPLLCVSVHEHAWMPDYGVWGKEEYLRQFWECVDWYIVEYLYGMYE
ncbi:hypothetical protein OC834_001905 [Tilletia horrida]|nr:hypothetical protein OC834_001905 [Tilletia horrida]